MRKKTVYALISLGVLGVDRVLKFLVISYIPPASGVQVLPFFRITRVYNTGMAFGLFPGFNTLLIWINILLASVIGCLVFGRKVHHGSAEPAAFSLILGGAVSNIWDRIFYGGVIDYIDTGFWPVFNAADAAITAGALIILVRMALKTTGERT